MPKGKGYSFRNPSASKMGFDTSSADMKKMPSKPSSGKKDVNVNKMKNSPKKKY